MKKTESQGSSPIEVTAIFDIGKTNKKFFLFDEDFNIVSEESTTLPEIQDDDGFACEDLASLTQWINNTFDSISINPKFKIKDLNFSTYGASFVHLDRDGEPVAPLYNYLKPFPEDLKATYYKTYGNEHVIARQTASPILGNLNSGMQIYMIKYAKPDIFKKIGVSLHLPQYVSSIFTKHFFSDITSIGCHTQLWDFEKNNYHQWTLKEKLDLLLSPIAAADSTITVTRNNQSFQCGIGLHDSSAAIIPYLQNFKEPFILLSTGTWSISLNPFNHEPLTAEELQQDCLCYYSYSGAPVKASRLFAGYEHERQVKKLATHFNMAEDYFTHVEFNPALLTKDSAFANELSTYSSYEEAYHSFMKSLMTKQVQCTSLVFTNNEVTNIFVDGGFSKNDIFMNLLAKSFPTIKIYASSVAQATALGAALVLKNQDSKLSNQNFSMRHYKAQ